MLICRPRARRLLLSPLLRGGRIFRAFPMFSPSKHGLCFYATRTGPVPTRCGRVHCDLYDVSFGPRSKAFNRGVSALIGTTTVGGDVSFPEPSCSNRCVVFALSSCKGFSV